MCVRVTVGCGTRVKHRDIRVRSLDCFVEPREAILAIRVVASRIASDPIFVAYFDILEIKWLGMTQLCTS